MLIRAGNALLLIVDVQTRLAPAVAGPGRCVAQITRLLEMARLLEVPVIASEQYPEGLGPIVPELRDRLRDGEIVTKLAFSAAHEEHVRDAVAMTGRRLLVLAGMEAHVCVLQTALGFKALGFEPHVVADACASRAEPDRELALARLRREGVPVVSTEMVLFEWLERAGTPVFRAALPLLKDQNGTHEANGSRRNA